MAADDRLSKTVRIDLMPDIKTPGMATGHASDLLARVNWSTRQRQVAVEDARTHSRYEALLESVYDAAVITAPSGKIIEVNGRAVEFLRYTRGQLCEMSMADLIDGADESVMRNIAETLLTERFALLQAFCRRQDGSVFPAEIAVNRLSMDNVRLCFFIRDVTVRYETEALLRTEHTAVQTCASGIAICDTDGLLGYVNPAFMEMLGVGEGHLLNRDIREVMASDDRINSLITSALGNAETWMAEIEMENAGGDLLYIQVSATCSMDASGLPQGIVFAFADITAHRRAEKEELAAHEEMEARVKARTMDLLEQNDQLQKRLQELEAALAGRRKTGGEGKR